MLIAPNSVDAFGEQRFATVPSAVRKQELETDKSSQRIVTCRIDDLRQHPSYSRHHLVVPIAKISRLVDQGEQVFREPLTITRDRIIIDCYARWELARHLGRMMLLCLEYHLSEAEALQWILRAHQRSNGLNAFNRISLALDLEPVFQERARLNQRMGGQQKGSSNLTDMHLLSFGEI